MKKDKSKKSKKKYSLYFLGVVLMIYLFLFTFSRNQFFESLESAYSVFLKILPVFFLVFGLLFLVNYFIKAKQLIKHLGEESGTKGWLISIITGIISMGPIYMWYPLLEKLQKGGVRNGLIAAFLYNRAVKPPLLPLMVYYFGVLFTITLTGTMMAASIAQGLLVEKFMGVKI